jgi:hypothetical protein
VKSSPEKSPEKRKLDDNSDDDVPLSKRVTVKKEEQVDSDDDVPLVRQPTFLDNSGFHSKQNDNLD